MSIVKILQFKVIQDLAKLQPYETQEHARFIQAHWQLPLGGKIHFFCPISPHKAVHFPALWLVYIYSMFCSLSGPDFNTLTQWVWVTHTCTVFRAKLFVLFSCKSLSKYPMKGPGPPLPSFSICPRSDRSLQTEQEVEVTGCKQLRSWKGPGKFFSTHMLLPAQAEAGKRKSGGRTQAADLHHQYCLYSPVFKLQLKPKDPFRNKGILETSTLILVLNFKKDQDPHLLLALGSSDKSY